MTSHSDYSNLAVAYLDQQLDSGASGTFTATAINFNGSAVSFPSSATRFQIKAVANNEIKFETIGVSAVSQSGNTVTFTISARQLSDTDHTDFTSQGNGQTFPSGAIIYQSADQHNLGQAAFKDISNTFIANQLLSGTNEMQFGDSATAIWDDGTTLRFKSSSQASVTLDTLAATGGTDEKAGVSSNDTTPDYLVNKITGGDGIALTETNDGGDEDLDIDVDLATDPGLEFSSNQLRVKVKSGGGVTRDSDGLSVNSDDLGDVAGIFGDGNLGSVTWSSSTNLDPTSEYEYTDSTLDAGQTLSVSSVNSVLVIKNTGDVTINGTVDLNNQGGPEGTGGANCTSEECSATAGTSGTAGNSLVSGWTSGSGSGGDGGNPGNSHKPQGGGGAASVLADGTGGFQNSVLQTNQGSELDPSQLAFLSNLIRGVGCGGGGGGGGGASRAAGTGAGTTAGGDGGRGGGALVWVIAGNLTLGASSTIQCDGEDGDDSASGTGGEGGGGGGGGGGTILMLVSGTITDSGVTLSADGGAAGLVGGSLQTEKGGTGAAGKIIIYSLTDGTLVTS